ncbi:MAG TPA: PilZ domain-containing protein [Nitrospira sp.]|nr:PilZ domain-containing protein [Nitrospira sp.]
MRPSILTILIVNERAEEVKLVTISVRGFFPEIRIDIAYSAEEATVMASATASDWAVVLIDDACLVNAPSTFIEDLKHRSPYASVIFQSARTDSAAAMQALQVGADFFLYKQSPAFLTELLFCIKEAIDKRDWHLSSDRAQTRHRLLVESFGDAFYELDAESRFSTISPTLSALLGYQPEELMGHPYYILLSEAQAQLARFRFNERRASTRAVTGFELTLQGKRADGKTSLVRAEISARGLYDPSRRFIGTIGVIRDVSGQKPQQMSVQALQQQLDRTHDLRQLAQQVTERLAALTEEAARSAQLGERLARLIDEALRSTTGITINDLITELLNTSAPQPGDASDVSTDFATSLPDYHGDREQTLQLLQHLLAYARAHLSAAGRSRMLVVKTSAAGLTTLTDSPSLSPHSRTNYIEVTISETEREAPSGSPVASVSEPVEVMGLYRLARDLGTTLDMSLPAGGPFHMTARFPTEAQPSRGPSQPVPDVSTVPQTAEVSAPIVTPVVTQPIPRPIVPDRRVHPRVPTTLPAVVIIGSARWNGTVMNLSQGGASIGLPGDFPSIALQEASIVVRTAAAILELGGLVYLRTNAQPPTHPYLHMIVTFDPPTPTEAAVLASMIQAAREHTLTFTLEILLPATPPGFRKPVQTPSDFIEHDRRETLRIALALPARLETMRRQEPASRLVAQLINLSRTGVCLLVNERPEHLQRSVTIHFAPAHRSGQPGSYEPAAPDTPIHAEIVWSVSDTTAPSALHVPGLPYAARAGLRFHHLTPYGERELNRVIKQHVLAQQSSDALSAASPIISVPRECRNARGQTIAIADDHLGQLTDPTLATIIIAPGYGQTALDYAAFSYFLAEHHFRILRYDQTNHIGNSEGELQQTTLRSMQHDLAKVIEFVRHTWPQAPVMVIASDLAARAALKTAAQIQPLDLLILINPSIDVGSMLMAAHGHDLIADYQFGLRRGICNLLGLNVNVDQFVGDLIAGRFTDLESTLEDLRALRSPLCIGTSPATSAALPPADLPHAFMTALGAESKLVNISTPLTERNLVVQGAPPAAFKQLLKQIASVVPVPTIQPPQEIAAQPYLARQRRIEQEYTLLRHDASQMSREALSAAHLSQLPQVGNLHEYRKLLDDLYGLMSPLDPGAVLVDAGIGQSDLTRAALVNHTYRAGQASWKGRPSPLMVGVGRDGEAIGQARNTVRVLQRELATGFVGRLAAMPPLTIGWVQADWTNSLPFRNGSLDRLVCNLSLPYVFSPRIALEEWHRVLHPEGCLIVTTFHADTDLSTLYRRHLRQANQDEFSAQAQPLLHYFARLREGIRHGILHSFDETEFDALLRQCGMSSFRILPIFDGQALVAIVGKRNSSSSIR